MEVPSPFLWRFGFYGAYFLMLFTVVVILLEKTSFFETEYFRLGPPFTFFGTVVETRTEYIVALVVAFFNSFISSTHGNLMRSFINDLQSGTRSGTLLPNPSTRRIGIVLTTTTTLFYGVQRMISGEVLRFFFIIII